MREKERFADFPFHQNIFLSPAHHHHSPLPHLCQQVLPGDYHDDDDDDADDELDEVNYDDKDGDDE